SVQVHELSNAIHTVLHEADVRLPFRIETEATSCAADGFVECSPRRNRLGPQCGAQPALVDAAAMKSEERDKFDASAAIDAALTADDLNRTQHSHQHMPVRQTRFAGRVDAHVVD